MFKKDTSIYSLSFCHHIVSIDAVFFEGTSLFDDSMPSASLEESLQLMHILHQSVKKHLSANYTNYKGKMDKRRWKRFSKLVICYGTFDKKRLLFEN